jgi:hypothetical protein
VTVVARHIGEHRVAGKRLGRHVAHDPRSRAYPAARSAAPLRPVLWRRHGGALNQHSLGSCTGNAAAGCVNTEPFYRPRHLLHEDDAVSLYAKATLLDGFDGAYPPLDTGSTGLAVAKACVDAKLAGGYSHAFGIDHALAALQLAPVITGVDWYESFDTPNADGLVTIAGQVRGGHEFEVSGYDPASGLVAAWNSWGTRWARRGMFFMAAATWAQLLAAQGDVTVLAPAAAPA